MTPALFLCGPSDGERTMLYRALPQLIQLDPDGQHQHVYEFIGFRGETVIYHYLGEWPVPPLGPAEER
jgi:hypothetical protein